MRPFSKGRRARCAPLQAVGVSSLPTIQDHSGDGAGGGAAACLENLRPVTGVKRAREQHGTPILPPPSPVIVSPLAGLPAPTRQEFLETQHNFIYTLVHGHVFERLDSFKYMNALVAAECARAETAIAQAKDAADAAKARVAELEDELSFVNGALQEQLHCLKLARASAEKLRDNSHVAAIVLCG